MIVFRADREDFLFREANGVIWCRFSLERDNRTLAQQPSVQCDGCKRYITRGLTNQAVEPPEFICLRCARIEEVR